MDTIEKAMQKLGKPGAGAAPQKGITEQIEMRGSDAVYSTSGSGASLATVVSAKRNTGKRTRRSIAIDPEQLRQAGMLIPDSKRSRIKEEYRHIKRPLLMNALGKGATIVEHSNLIMVTSARQGEGKTFNAINLALSIASERDRTVLLVDADVVKPTVSRFFGIDSGPGLVDFLVEDNLDLSEVLVETNVPSLTILPAGNTHHLSTELLASGSMRQLAEEMSKRYSDRIIIFDSPPLLATTEASVLAHLMGQVVMVVESDRTRQAQVKEALALLKPEMIVGFVLNKSRSSFGSDYYYYGSYYGGYGQEKA